MAERTGVITAKGEFGIQLDGYEEWINYSKADYRGVWEEHDVGDTVEVVLSHSEKTGKDYIKQIMVEKRGTTPPASPSSDAPKHVYSLALHPRYLALKLAADRFQLSAESTAKETTYILTLADYFYAYITAADEGSAQ